MRGGEGLKDNGTFYFFCVKIIHNITGNKR